MMKIKEITDLVNQRPFRPFLIETGGGSWIEVEKEADIMLNPKRPDLVVVFDASGTLFMLSLEQISALEVK